MAWNAFRDAALNSQQLYSTCGYQINLHSCERFSTMHVKMFHCMYHYYHRGQNPKYYILHPTLCKQVREQFIVRSLREISGRSLSPFILKHEVVLSQNIAAICFSSGGYYISWLYICRATDSNVLQIQHEKVAEKSPFKSK